MLHKHIIPTLRPIDNTWRDLTDEELRRYLTSYRRRLVLVDEEVPAGEVREHTREFLAALVENAEQEDKRRERAAALGVPRDVNRYPDEWLADLKGRTLLDELLIYEAGARLGKPNKEGTRRGPCPFCKTSEHSDSFTVHTGDPADQWFYCFACQCRGDAISALMLSWGETFPQAVEHLARNANVTLPDARTTERARLATLPGRVAD